MGAFVVRAIEAHGIEVWVSSVVVAVAALVDVRSYRIRNRLVVPVLLTALIFHSFNSGLSGLVYSLQGMLAGFFLLFFLWLIGGMGAGDVKLLAAVGAWIGPWSVSILFMSTGLVLGVWVTACALYKCVERWCCARPLADRADQTLAETQDVSAPDRLERAVAQARTSGRRTEVIPFAAALLGGILLIVSGLAPLPL